MRSAVTRGCALGAAVVIGLAAGARAEAGRSGWTLDRVIEAAQRGPRSRAAHEATEEARGLHAEARGQRFPRFGMRGILAPSPEINCENPACTETSPEEASVDFEGVFARVELTLVQPLFTFGKLDAAGEASAHAIRASRSLEDALAGDIAVEAARAYYGLKLARETRWMLEDGREQLDDALAKVNAKIAEGSPDVTLPDRYRLETLSAEVDVRLADAREGEATALSGLRALVGDDTADVDDAPLSAIEYEIAAADDYAGQARAGQPEVRAATEGTEAARQAARLEAARYLPDLLLVGSLTLAHASEVDDPPSAFANDPYNTVSAGLALAVRWNFDPLAQVGRVRKAEARSRRARWVLEAVRRRADFQAREAHHEVTRTADRLEAARRGEKSARAWLAATLQADAIGAADTKDLADAHLAYFTARARTLTAIFDWDVAVFRLRRVTGEFSTPDGVQPDRPTEP